jgi:hypothetical protein
MSLDKPQPKLPEAHFEGSLLVRPTAEDVAKAREEAEKNTEQTYKDRQLALNSRMVWFTLALFVCTLITAFINGIQTYVANKSANSARDAAIASQQASDTADKSVLLAQKSERDSRRDSEAALAQNRDQFQQAQRPYLWQVSAVGSDKSNMQYTWGTEEGNPDMSVTIKIQNFGQSPAIVTRFGGDVELGITKGDLARLSGHSWMTYSSVMPPGRVDNFTVASRETIPKNFGGRPNHKAAVSMLLRIRYTNTEGHPFESDTCMLTPSGIDQIADYCPADLHLTRLIDCKQERCEE